MVAHHEFIFCPVQRTNTFHLFPHDVISTISEYVDSKTKKDLLLVDRRTSAIALDAIKSISIFRPSKEKDESKVPEDILSRVLCRRPKLSSIHFDVPNRAQHFCVSGLTCLKTLLPHFEKHSGLLGENYPSLKTLAWANFLLTDAGLDRLTQRLSRLECFKANLSGISEEGMGILGRNCPNLKILDVWGGDGESFTDSKLDQLTQGLPYLESIKIEEAYTITEEGVSAIARNCKKLRCISFRHFGIIGKTGFEALIRQYPDLRILSLSYGSFIPMEELYRFFRLVDEDGKLRRVGLYRILDVPQEELNVFYKELGTAKVLTVSSAMELHACTLQTPL